MNVNHWKSTQVQARSKGFQLPQDQQLSTFVVDNHIKNFLATGDISPDYIENILKNCTYVDHRPVDLLIVFANHLEMKLEEILVSIHQHIQYFAPDWIYLAINKYLVTTDQIWNDLTDNYDQDLMNTVSNFVCEQGYNEIARNNILDIGSSFNFVHPTTNMYFKISA